MTFAKNSPFQEETKDLLKILRTEDGNSSDIQIEEEANNLFDIVCEAGSDMMTSNNLLLAIAGVSHHLVSLFFRRLEMKYPSVDFYDGINF